MALAEVAVPRAQYGKSHRPIRDGHDKIVVHVIHPALLDDVVGSLTRGQGAMPQLRKFRTLPSFKTKRRKRPR